MNPTTPTPADALTQGDIILYQGDLLQVDSEPEYLMRGIVFDALPLDLEKTGETQELCLHPQQIVQLVDYQPPAADPAASAA